MFIMEHSRNKVKLKEWNKDHLYKHILEQWFSSGNRCQNLEGSFKHRFLGSTSRVSDSVFLEWAPRIFISNKFLGDADIADLGMTL